MHMRRRRPRHHSAGRAQRVASVAAIIVVMSATAALAWTAGTTNPGNSITAATVGSVGSYAASPNSGFPTCNSIVLTWTAATNATSYSIEYQNDSTTGSWTTLNSSVTALTYTDTNAGTHLNSTVYYRITPQNANWTGSSSVVNVQCGIGRVLDLALTNQCTNNVLTWTTPYNNTGTYRVEYSTNGGGAWTSLGNVAASTTGTMSYINQAAPVLTRGTTYIYRVTPNSGAGSVSAASNSISWDNFHVDSVTLGTNGGTLTNNDTVQIDFSKSVVTSGVANAAKMTVSPKTVMYLGNAGITLNNGIGSITTGNIWSNTGNKDTTLNGTPVWSSIGSWTTARLTWTSDGSSSQGGTLSQSGTVASGTWADGAGQAQCDPTPSTLPAGTIAKVNLVAPPAGVTTTLSGRF